MVLTMLLCFNRGFVGICYTLLSDAVPESSEASEMASGSGSGSEITSKSCSEIGGLGYGVMQQQQLFIISCAIPISTINDATPMIIQNSTNNMMFSRGDMVCRCEPVERSGINARVMVYGECGRRVYG
jgi:hypothetical protein